MENKSQFSDADEQQLVWGGLHVCQRICPPPEGRMAYPASSNHCITFHVANADQLERRLDGGKWLRSPSYPGGLTFVPAHQAPEWWWDAEVELLELSVSPAYLEQVAIATFEQSPQKIELIDRFAMRDPFLEQLALAFKKELERGMPINKLYLESLQNVLAMHLLQNHCTITAQSPKIPKGLSKKHLQQVVDYIQSNLEQEISLADLAEIVQMSSYQFGKRFKQSTGLPPHRYVLQSRIERAKELLTHSHLSIAIISQQVGFYDQSHFTHTFRKHTLFTPRQYRNRL